MTLSIWLIIAFIILLLLFWIDDLLFYKELYGRDKFFKLSAQITPSFVRVLTKKLEIEADNEAEARGFVKDCILETLKEINYDKH